MVKDQKGDIYTHSEFLEKKINEIQANFEGTQMVTKRLLGKKEYLEKTPDMRRLNQTRNELLETIGGVIPSGMYDLLDKLDSCHAQTLTIYYEYFYKLGYYDAIYRRVE